ncbi:recombinase family protein [Ferroacidibacillus organovorans]|nr:recombinase family protein [Ferroacidibacillus organovorans]KYP81155.1 hypothetical protein AYJ22_08340 [Ferroacidibacillus organovorans]OAG93820.1 hypothetical protein AYW79_08490 [Ferroacidibacillus organovorans]
MRCAIYARVSTDRQGESVDHQVSLLREFAKRRGQDWEVLEHLVFEDEGVSATKVSIWTRPAMKRLMEAAERSEVDVVLFKGISRLARNTQEALDVLDRLRARGLRVLSYEESYDSAKENSNFMFTMHAAIAEYEAEKIGVRVRLGNKEKAKSGRWVGGTPPDGYYVGRDGHLVPDDARAGLIRSIFERYALDGSSCAAIARELNARGETTSTGNGFSQTAVARILDNEVYAGHLVYNRRTDRTVRDYDSEVPGKKKERRMPNVRTEWVVVHCAHPPLVTPDLVQMAQMRRGRVRSQAPRTTHLLTGVLSCGRCRAPLIAQVKRTAKRVYRYYVCRTYHQAGRQACAQGSVPADDLESYVLTRLSERLREVSINVLAPALQSACAQGEEQAKRERERINRQLTRLTDAWIAAQVDDVLAGQAASIRGRIARLTAERDALYKRLTQAGLHRHKRAQEIYARLVDLAQDEPAMKRYWVQMLISSLVVHDRTLLIQYTFSSSDDTPIDGNV